MWQLLAYLEPDGLLGMVSGLMLKVALEERRDERRLANASLACDTEMKVKGE